MKRHTICSWALALLFATLSGPAIYGQRWQKIIPLVSKCEDVKKTFGVFDCRLPVTRYESKEFDVRIQFSVHEDGWNVSADTVVDVMVIFHDLVKLEDFETDLDGYLVKREDDVPEITIYDNNQKGIRLTVKTSVAPEPYISSILLYPSKQNAEIFKCQRD